MKIQTGENVGNLQKMQTTTPDARKHKEVEASGPDGDNLQLSAKAQEYNRVKGILEKTPDVRQERVAQLKQQIQSGTYHPDTDAVTDAVIRDSLIDLLA